VAQPTPAKPAANAMRKAAASNDDLTELLQLKAIIAYAIDQTDSARDIKSLSIEYREILEDIREIGGPPKEVESPADRARKAAEHFKN
jgi:hypothetical protein